MLLFSPSVSIFSHKHKMKGLAKIYSFTLLITSNASGIVLGAKNIVLNKTNKVPLLTDCAF